MFDNFVIKAFKEIAKAQGMGYQTLINQALRKSLEQQPVTEDSFRQVLREELGCYGDS